MVLPDIAEISFVKIDFLPTLLLQSAHNAVSVNPPRPRAAVTPKTAWFHSATSMKKEPQMHTDCTQLSKRKAGFR